MHFCAGGAQNTAQPGQGCRAWLAKVTNALNQYFYYTKTATSVSIIVTMKNIILSLVLVLLASGCSRKSTGTLPVSGSGQFNPQESAETLPVPSGQFIFGAEDIASPVKVETNRFGTFTIDFKLAGVKSAELHQFTQAHLKQRVEIMFGSNVLTSPIISGVISNGEVVESFPSSESKEACAVADLLNEK